MRWHLNVPTVLHLYWGLDPMHPIRWKTVTSFARLNPTWEIVIHRPTTKGEEPAWDTGENIMPYTGACAMNEMPHVRHQYHDMPGISDVQRSDLLRWELLGTVGGVWSDFDIIYTRAMDTLVFNDESHRDCTTFLCMWGFHNEHRIGFLMSTPGNPMFMAVHDMALNAMNDQMGYQSLGCDLLNVIDVKFGGPVVNMPREVVYPFHPTQIYDYSGLFISLPKNSIGLHWYGGHAYSMNYMKHAFPCLLTNL